MDKNLDLEFDAATAKVLRRIDADPALRSDARTIDTCLCVLAGGRAGAAYVLESCPSLKSLWESAGTDCRAETLLKVLSLTGLTVWLSLVVHWPLDAREEWGAFLLRLFDDPSRESYDQFLSRDTQFRWHLESSGSSSQGGSSLVWQTLLYSDISAGLGGQPIFSPMTIAGFPYESTYDLFHASEGALAVNPQPDLVEISPMIVAIEVIARSCSAEAKRRFKS